MKNWLNLKILATSISAAASIYSTVCTAENDANLSAIGASKGHSVLQFSSLDGVISQSQIYKKFGVALTDLETYKDSSGNSQFIGVWAPGSTDFILEQNTNWSDFVYTWNEKSSDGFRLKDVERLSTNGTTTYYSLFDQGSGDYAMYQGNWTDFTNHWANTSANEGLRLIDVDVLGTGSSRTYLGTYIEGSGGYIFYSTPNYSTFMNQFNQAKAGGFELIDIDITRNSGTSISYTGVWRPGGSQGLLSMNNSWDAFKQDWASKVSQGYELIDMDISEGDSTNSFQQFIGSYRQISMPNLSTFNPDIDTMGDYLDNILIGPTVVEGMSYAISHNGQLARSGASGNALRGINNPTGSSNIPMTSETHQTLASVTKMLTAPLVHRLLRLRNIDVNAKISDWIPSGWNKGLGFGNGPTDLTFKQLLSHTSGLTQAGFQNSTRWSDLQTLVANSASTSITSPSFYSYGNVNYALLRVLIPTLRNGIPSHSNPDFRNPVDGSSGSTASTWQDHWNSYSDYIHYLIADDFNIPVTCDANSQLINEAFFYTRNTSGSGVNWSTSIFGGDDCGGHQGLRMSAQQLVQYWDRVRYDDTILNEAERNRIRGGQGTMPTWSNSLSINGTTWYAVGHNGNLAWGDANGSGDLNTCLVEFPGNVTASLIFNSSGSLSPSVCQHLRDAYEVGVSGLIPFSTITFQAESAFYSGAIVESEHSGYTGTGYVNTYNYPGNWIGLDVNNIPFSGIYSLEIRFANGSGTNRPLDVEINGTVETTVNNQNTGSWTSWSAVTVNIPLEAGNNWVRLIATGANGAANIDRVTVNKAFIFSPI